MSYESVVNPELLENGHGRERERDIPGADLFGAQNHQLPAPPRADAYASFVPVAQAARMQRADEAALQKAAVRVGALLGEDGFYRFPAGGSTIEGPNVRLAKALANRWGAVAFGVEVDRIEGNRVFLTATCVDLLTLVVVKRGHTQELAPAPAKFANKADQRARWEAMQVQSAASKTLRGAILDCLPAWFVGPAFESAKAESRKQVLKEGQTIESARDDVVRAFAAWKVTRAELEAVLEVVIVEWSTQQIVELRELYRSIKNNETTVDEVFQEVRSRAPATEGASVGKAALGLDKGAKASSKSGGKATAAKSEPVASAGKAAAEPAKAPELTREHLEWIATVKAGKDAVGPEGAAAAQKAAGIPEPLRPEDMSIEQLKAFDAQINAAADQLGS